MEVRVLLFARAKELYGRAETSLDLETAATPAMCFEQLCGDAPDLAPLRPSLLVAVNEVYAAWDQELSVGDEIAFIPPVSGG